MFKRLPDAEFEVMKAIWASTPPVTTLEVMDNLSSDKSWKPQTVLAMLVRLIEKGFLKSERAGRERNYTPCISSDDYMRIETGDFMRRYSVNSLGNLMKALCNNEKLSRKERREMMEWLHSRESK